MDNRETALLIAKILDSKKALDVTIIDLAEASGFADYFVIASAGNIRLLSALADEVEDKLAEKEIFINHKEGENSSGWILLDYGDIIVNLFTEEQRQRYNIEKIWGDCIRVDFEPEEN